MNQVSDNNLVDDDYETVGLWGLQEHCTVFMEQYGVPFAQHCISIAYFIYLQCTLMNVAICLLKYVPTGMYMYKFIKTVYLTSRERIRLKQMEIDDIQLQIEIVNTKLSVHDAEYTERAEQLRRGAERLRRVRARVRDVIATDESIKRALERVTAWDEDQELHMHFAAQEEDREIMVELLKEKYDKAERASEKMDGSARSQTDPNTPENSVYSSLSDVDARQDCRVKIVKVTNVYKVAYLRHYIKQKRLRRATRQALLKKKMESIKKLLEDWQKTLNMVINSKLTILNIDTNRMDMSQEAMGDYSKPREFSDSDSDIRNNFPDMCYDEYSLSWSQNPYRPYAYNYEDVPETAISREYYDSEELCDIKYSQQVCERKTTNMTSIVEETNSQIAVDEEDGADDNEYHDLISL